jgi:hypothetical protein
MIETAIEELLRIGPPLHQLGRTTAHEVVIDGTTIPAGEHVGLNFASANFDEEAFPNAAHRDIERKPNRHLTFGTGPHICIGAPLARMELRLAVAELLARTSSFELAGDPVRVTGLKSGFTYLCRFAKRHTDGPATAQRRQLFWHGARARARDLLEKIDKQQPRSSTRSCVGVDRDQRRHGAAAGLLSSRR